MVVFFVTKKRDKGTGNNSNFYNFRAAATERKRASRLRRSEAKKISDNLASKIGMKKAFDALNPSQKAEKAAKAKIRMRNLRARRLLEAINARSAVQEPEQPQLVNSLDSVAMNSAVTERDPYEGEVEYHDGAFSDVEVEEEDPLGPSYEVETILGQRFNKRLECLEFFVKWKDYPDSCNSWEKEGNLLTWTRDIERVRSE